MRHLSVGTFLTLMFILLMVQTAADLSSRAAPMPAGDVVEDLFGENDDLTLGGFPHSESLKAVPRNRVISRQLSPERRLYLFNTLVEHVFKLSGPKPAIKGPQARNSAWMQLLSLATTSEQLEQVASMFPGWGEARREFNDHIGYMLIRALFRSTVPSSFSLVIGRCVELDCPILALKVFGNHSKYSIPLSLEGARHLLYSLHLRHSIEDTITASALYGVYRLLPVSKDPTSSAILTYACLSHPNEKSLAIAKALIPGLKRYLALVPQHPNREIHGFNVLPTHLKQSLRRIKLHLTESQSKDSMVSLIEYNKFFNVS
jgi:hypothetical protein